MAEALSSPEVSAVVEGDMEGVLEEDLAVDSGVGEEDLVAEVHQVAGNKN